MNATQPDPNLDPRVYSEDLPTKVQGYLAQHPYGLDFTSLNWACQDPRLRPTLNALLEAGIIRQDYKRYFLA